MSLELGGKNALVVCDDADLDNAVQWARLAAFSNAGQRCAASSRIIVFEKVYEPSSRSCSAATRGLKLGVADDCDLGPVINARQLANMTLAVDRARGRRWCAVLAAAARARTAALADGFYMQPTVLGQASRPEAEISRTELFGPITALYSVAGFEEAVSTGEQLALRADGLDPYAQRRPRADLCRPHADGVAVVNAGTHGSEPHMPFGGVKASGNGTREPGTEALDIYCELATSTSTCGQQRWNGPSSLTDAAGPSRVVASSSGYYYSVGIKSACRNGDYCSEAAQWEGDSSAGCSGHGEGQGSKLIHADPPDHNLAWKSFGSVYPEIDRRVGVQRTSFGEPAGRYALEAFVADWYARCRALGQNGRARRGSRRGGWNAWRESSLSGPGPH